MKALLFAMLLFSLPYKPHELEWSDYKGKPDGRFAAMTQSGINTDYKVDESGFVYDIQPNAVFYPHNSYTTRTDDFNLLQHERLHFKITRLFANRLKQSLKGLKLKESEFESIRIKLIDEWIKTDDYYDEQTKHSANRIEQEHWEKLINEQIQK